VRVRSRPVLLPEEVEALLQEIPLSGHGSTRSGRSGKTDGPPFSCLPDSETPTRLAPVSSPPSSRSRLQRVRDVPDGFTLFDLSTLRILDANSFFCDRVVACSREALIGKKITDFLPDTREQILRMAREIRKSGPVEKDGVIRRLDRSLVPLSMEATIVPYEEREAVLVQFRNNAPRSRTKDIGEIFRFVDRRILGGEPVDEIYPALTADLLKLFSLAVAVVLKRDREGWSRILALSSALPEKSENLQEALGHFFAGGTFALADKEFLSRGSRYIVETTECGKLPPVFSRYGIEAGAFFPVNLPEEFPVRTIIGIFPSLNSTLDTHVLGVLEDLTTKMAIASLHEEERAQIRLQKRAMEAVDTPICVADPQGRPEWANPAFLDSKGCSFEELPDFPGYFFSRYKKLSRLPKTFRKQIAAGKTYKSEYVSPKKDGTSFPVEIRIFPVLGEDNALTHMVCVETDLTRKRREEEDLHRKACFDPLTQLPDRRRLKDDLSRSMAVARRTSRSLALLFLDLDGFKAVNDTHGHDFGDKLLVGVAGRLRSLLRRGDHVFRVGGDEFVVILNHVKSTAEVQGAPSRILSALRTPYLIDNRSVGVGVSIGIALYPDDDTDESGLLRDADLAMYRAKNHGKNKFVIYTPGERKTQSAMTGKKAENASMSGFPAMEPEKREGL